MTATPLEYSSDVRIIEPRVALFADAVHGLRVVVLTAGPHAALPNHWPWLPLREADDFDDFAPGLDGATYMSVATCRAIAGPVALSRVIPIGAGHYQCPLMDKEPPVDAAPPVKEDTRFRTRSFLVAVAQRSTGKVSLVEVLHSRSPIGNSETDAPAPDISGGWSMLLHKAATERCPQLDVVGRFGGAHQNDLLDLVHARPPAAGVTTLLLAGIERAKARRLVMVRFDLRMVPMAGGDGVGVPHEEERPDEQQEQQQSRLDVAAAVRTIGASEGGSTVSPLARWLVVLSPRTIAIARHLPPRPDGTAAPHTVKWCVCNIEHRQPAGLPPKKRSTPPPPPPSAPPSCVASCHIDVAAVAASMTTPLRHAIIAAEIGQDSAAPPAGVPVGPCSYEFPPNEDSPLPPSSELQLRWMHTLEDLLQKNMPHGLSLARVGFMFSILLCKDRFSSVGGCSEVRFTPELQALLTDAGESGIQATPDLMRGPFSVLAVVPGAHGRTHLVRGYAGTFCSLRACATEFDASTVQAVASVPSSGGVAPVYPWLPLVTATADCDGEQDHGEVDHPNGDADAPSVAGFGRRDGGAANSEAGAGGEADDCEGVALEPYLPVNDPSTHHVCVPARIGDRCLVDVCGTAGASRHISVMQFSDRFFYSGLPPAAAVVPLPSGSPLALRPVLHIFPTTTLPTAQSSTVGSTVHWVALALPARTGLRSLSSEGVFLLASSSSSNPGTTTLVVEQLTVVDAPSGSVELDDSFEGDADDEIAGVFPLRVVPPCSELLCGGHVLLSNGNLLRIGLRRLSVGDDPDDDGSGAMDHDHHQYALEYGFEAPSPTDGSTGIGRVHQAVASPSAASPCEQRGCSDSALMIRFAAVTAKGVHVGWEQPTSPQTSAPLSLQHAEVNCPTVCNAHRRVDCVALGGDMAVRRGGYGPQGPARLAAASDAGVLEVLQLVVDGGNLRATPYTVGAIEPWAGHRTCNSLAFFGVDHLVATTATAVRVYRIADYGAGGGLQPILHVNGSYFAPVASPPLSVGNQTTHLTGNDDDTTATCYMAIGGAQPVAIVRSTSAVDDEFTAAWITDAADLSSVAFAAVPSDQPRQQGLLVTAEGGSTGKGAEVSLRLVGDVAPSAQPFTPPTKPFPITASVIPGTAGLVPTAIAVLAIPSAASSVLGAIAVAVSPTCSALLHAACPSSSSFSHPRLLLTDICGGGGSLTTLLPLAPVPAATRLRSSSSSSSSSLSSSLVDPVLDLNVTTISSAAAAPPAGAPSYLVATCRASGCVDVFLVPPLKRLAQHQHQQDPDEAIAADDDMDRDALAGSALSERHPFWHGTAVRQLASVHLASAHRRFSSFIPTTVSFVPRCSGTSDEVTSFGFAVCDSTGRRLQLVVAAAADDGDLPEECEHLKEEERFVGDDASVPRVLESWCGGPLSKEERGCWHHHAGGWVRLEGSWNGSA